MPSDEHRISQVYRKRRPGWNVMEGIVWNSHGFETLGFDDRLGWMGDTARDFSSAVPAAAVIALTLALIVGVVQSHSRLPAAVPASMGV